MLRASLLLPPPPISAGAAVLSGHCLHEEIAFPTPGSCCAGDGAPPYWVGSSHAHSPSQIERAALHSSSLLQGACVQWDSSPVVLSSCGVYFHLIHLQTEKHRG